MTSRRVYLVMAMYETARGSVSYPVVAYDTEETAATALESLMTDASCEYSVLPIVLMEDGPDGPCTIDR